MEAHYCSNCGSRLEPDAKFCWNCGRPVHVPDQAPKPEEDAPTSRLSSSSPPPLPPLTVPPAAPPPTSPPPLPQPQLREGEARGGTTWHRRVMAGGGISWPMLALAGVFLVLIVVETMQEGMSEAIRVVPLVAAVVLVGSVVSYLSLSRRYGGATLRKPSSTGRWWCWRRSRSFCFLSPSSRRSEVRLRRLPLGAASLVVLRGDARR